MKLLKSSEQGYTSACSATPWLDSARITFSRNRPIIKHIPETNASVGSKMDKSLKCNNIKTQQNKEDEAYLWVSQTDDSIPFKFQHGISSRPAVSVKLRTGAYLAACNSTPTKRKLSGSAPSPPLPSYAHLTVHYLSATRQFGQYQLSAISASFWTLNCLWDNMSTRWLPTATTSCADYDKFDVASAKRSQRGWSWHWSHHGWITVIQF